MSAIDLLSGLVLEDGRRWGDAAAPYPWQWADARAVLEGPQRRCMLTRPRGASKTTDIAAVIIADLLELAPPRSRSYCIAVDRDQGRLVLDSIDSFVENTDGLAGALRVDKWVVTTTQTGSTLEVLAADAPGAMGKRPRRLIVDEFAEWPVTFEYRRLWSALFSAITKTGGRLAVLTSAGDPHHPAGKLIERARTSPAWYVDEVPGPCPWIAKEDLDEDRAELPEWEFQRFHLNRWTSPADRVARAEDLAACVTLDGPLEPRPRVRYRMALDIGLVKDRTVAAVGHVERGDDGERLVLDRMEVWQGSRREPVKLSAVEEWLVATSRTYGRAKLLFDPYQAERSVEGIVARGVFTERVNFTPAENSRRALLLHQLIRSHALALPDDPDLIDELAHVRLIETSPSVYRLDHDASRHDDRAVVLSMLAMDLLGGGIAGPARLTSPARSPERVPTRERARRSGLILPGKGVSRRGIAGLPRVAGRRGGRRLMAQDHPYPFLEALTDSDFRSFCVCEWEAGPFDTIEEAAAAAWFHEHHEDDGVIDKRPEDRSPVSVPVSQAHRRLWTGPKVGRVDGRS